MKCKTCGGEVEFIRIGMYVEGFRHKDEDADHCPLIDRKELDEWLKDTHCIDGVKE